MQIRQLLPRTHSFMPTDAPPMVFCPELLQRSSPLQQTVAMAIETLGIPYCIDQTTNRRYDRSAIELPSRPWGDHLLRCGGCTARVNAVKSSRRGKHNEVHVRPFFRLHPGVQHDEGCEFSWDVAAGRLIEQHRAALTKHGDVIELRLPTSVAEGGAVKPPAPTVTGGPRQTKLQVTNPSGSSIPEALASARAIAKLLRERGTSGASDRFKVRFNGTLIAWDDFYIDLRDQNTYLEQIRRLDSLADRHPLAVVGTVLKHSTTRNEVPYLEISQGRGIKPTRGMGWLHARLVSAVHDLSGYADGSDVLAYGQWKVYEAHTEWGDRWLSLYVANHQSITKHNG